MSKSLKIGLVGFGNIGTGVVRHLAEHGALIASRLPRPLVLKTICDIDLERDRGVSTAGIKLTTDYHEIISDPEIEVVIELVGGTKFAHTVVSEALAAGKNVVTANKALLATFGGELFEKAAAGKAHLLFEASVGAGIPLMRALQTGLQADRIKSLHGIVNGTCNFILSAMEDRPGVAFKPVLEEAMKLGYAEPDPTLDIEGDDAAHKTAVLGALAFGRDLRAGDVVKEGIVRVSPAEFAFAGKRGQTIKLLASAAQSATGDAELAVWPTLVPANHLVGRVRGVTNTLWIEADPIGGVMLAGPGAGQGSTSSGVLSDVCLIAQAGDSETLGRLHPLRIPRENREPGTAPVKHPRRYLRVAGAARGEAKGVLKGWRVLEEGPEAISFVAPEQTAEERRRTMESLAGAGISADSVCELRVALQDPAGVLGA